MSVSKPKSFNRNDQRSASDQEQQSPEQRALLHCWDALENAVIFHERQNSLLEIDAADAGMEVVGLSINSAGDVTVDLDINACVRVPLQWLLGGSRHDVSGVLALIEKLPKPVTGKRRTPVRGSGSSFSPSGPTDGATPFP